MAIMVCISASLIFLVITRWNINLHATNVGRNVEEFTALGKNMVLRGPGACSPEKNFEILNCKRAQFSIFSMDERPWI